MILTLSRVLVAATAVYLAAMDSWWFLLSVLLLVAMFAWVAYSPWLDRQHTPPPHHPAHRRAGQPWTPWDRDYDLGMSPEDWDALETLLADEDSLAQAEAAEQEARRS